ncbi:MAG TPA: glycoside hydrolase family 47 protein [Longimicrobiales bacterium]|nr:glycoside hydrolase family 47 protein [Longimicrobiales bacterium]
MPRPRLFALAAAALLAGGCDAPEPAPSVPARIPVALRREVLSVNGLPTDSAFAEEVRDAFLHAWSSYEAHAWGHDALRPLSKGWRDWYAEPLLMTPVDAYDTMVLMGLDAEARRTKRLVFDELSFDHDMTVQVFEVNIRILGGLLSAYQMDGDARWLELATDLADRMLPAFASPTGLPYVRVNLATGAVEGSENNPAEIGTLTLEFGLLSDLTGDRRYMDAVKGAVTRLHAQRSTLGLVGSVIDVQNGDWLDAESHVRGGIDSYYEYLLKAWLLFGDEDFETMWRAGRSALDAHLAHETDGRLWYGQADMLTGARTGTRFGALDAFLPAVLALGGDLERAARLQESVAFMWETFGVEPESFDYVTLEMGHPGYPLRPEAIESACYLYVLTGDERWREMGKDMFRRVVAATRVDAGFAHLKDVRTGEKDDAMESFFLAETLKYAWLLAVPTALDFDAVVFNTEAHPLRPVG